MSWKAVVLVAKPKNSVACCLHMVGSLLFCVRRVWHVSQTERHYLPVHLGSLSHFIERVKL